MLVTLVGESTVESYPHHGSVNDIIWLSSLCSKAPNSSSFSQKKKKTTQRCKTMHTWTSWMTSSDCHLYVARHQTAHHSATKQPHRVARVGTYGPHEAEKCLCQCFDLWEYACGFDSTWHLITEFGLLAERHCKTVLITVQSWMTGCITIEPLRVSLFHGI